MPTNRTKRSPLPRSRMALAAAAWTAGDWHGLNRLLGIRPHQWSPFDVGGERPAFHNAPWNAWERAAELRRQLIELAGPPGRVGRHGEPLGCARSAVP